MTVRPLVIGDAPAVADLHAGVGWAARSAAGWRWAAANPALTQAGAPLGWVVADAEDRPAACLGNWLQRFRLGDRVLFGATGFNLIVPPDQRGRSRHLVRALLDQPDLFAAWTFNANPRSAPLYARHGMQAWPETHSLKLSWTVDPLACLEGRAWRSAIRARPRLADGLGERLMNPRLGRTPDLRLDGAVTRLADLGDRSAYAAFWQALVSQGRLVADRSPAMLRWRLDDPDLRRAPLILAFWRGSAITGTALATVAKGSIIDPPVIEVLDLIALDGEAEAVPALTRALIGNARRLGAAKVRLQMVSPRLLEQLGPLAARARREGGWGHCHVRFAPDAPDPDLWSPTPYDGDYAVCLREPPAAGARRRILGAASRPLGWRDKSPVSG